ncbi:alpha/beta hydrolase family protein [Chryseobacterium caseinilyticum]|uniref:Prolyl oligopeptidase family serine peptidase n=1 Tax=Chryseobacterium caseinilyticum TaxID=2771428 RepID=A0ABR8ZGX8_9FLAO|nr:prolyl oligopeptidase family serine peptidase [Chryseobacterium caseinilyticum]MBD8084560.1 prolyl oligopeptidase family serine peptidase [Chryseobacterium caseinilyticum]
MKTFFKTLALLFFSNLFSAQQTKDDSLRLWASKFSDVKSLMVTEDGKHAAVNLYYPDNGDTTFVFSEDRRNPVDTVLNINTKKAFIGNRHFFGCGEGRAVFLDMATRHKIFYKEVKAGNAIQNQKQYYILGKNKELTIYNLSGRPLHMESKVESVTGDEKRLFFVRRVSEGNNRSELLEWNGRSIISRSNTGNTIDKIEITKSGKFLSVREKTSAGAMTCTVLNIKDGKLFTPRIFQPLRTDGLKLTEIGNGESFLIVSESEAGFSEPEMVEVWYANDTDLRFKNTGKIKYRYWHWFPGKGIETELPTDLFQVYAPLRNSRYFLAFSIGETNDYINSAPFYNICLYDSLEKTAKLIFPGSSEVTASEDGNAAVSYSWKDRVWKVYNLNTMSTAEIKDNGYKNPAFTSDGKQLIFSGKTDLYSYDLKLDVMTRLGISASEEVTVLNKKIQPGFAHFKTKFNNITADLSKPLLLQLYKPETGETSVVKFSKGQTSVLLPRTANKIREVLVPAGQNQSKLYTVQENHNTPPGIYLSEKKNGIRRLLYQTNGSDKKTAQLKLETLSYRNKAGTPLKAVLSYPVNFDASKKYPVIVRIYQRQSNAASVYITGEVRQDGFNKRLLLQKGYFIYQPDVVFDDRGTGISSLDCVHSAIDALKEFPFINQDKIGLTGHSMGGYETNFIATQSRRFAAYLSGASVGDIMQSYFSYNRLFRIAYYARFEDGQFEMNRPYVGHEELYFRNNPINYVQNVTSPVLLWSGRKDGNVLPEQTEAFYMGLLRNRKKVIALFYRDQEHTLGYNTPEAFDLNRRTVEWWDYFLKDKKNVDWIDREMKEGR